jgi:hypothetical protein
VPDVNSAGCEYVGYVHFTDIKDVKQKDVKQAALVSSAAVYSANVTVARFEYLFARSG